MGRGSKNSWLLVLPFGLYGLSWVAAYVTVLGRRSMPLFFWSSKRCIHCLKKIVDLAKPLEGYVS